MAGDVICIGRGSQLLRGADAEKQRLARMKLRRRAAYDHAVYGCYNKADLAAFGPEANLLHEGRDPERQLLGPGARRQP